MGNENYSERVDRARSEMRRAGLSHLLVGPSADFRYLTGANLHTSERLSLLMLAADGPQFIVTPGFEKPLLPPLPGNIEVKTWDDTTDPAPLAASLLTTQDGSNPRIGVADQVWAVFLLHLQRLLPEAAFTHGAEVLTALRKVKTPDEVAKLREAGRIVDEIFAELVTGSFAGRTELEIAGEIASMLKQAGTEAHGTPIVASGPNSASPHHHAGDRIISTGDFVVLDFGGPHNGYFSDITRTVYVGTPPDQGSEEERVYNLVKRAQQAAYDAARPGITGDQLDRVARDIFTQEGYGEYFSHRLGHGIGLDGHEPPYIVGGNDVPLVPGNCFSIEPGLYLPGKFGVRIEDIVVMGAEGAERFNNATRDLITVV